jgi:hypothetical protein
LEFSRLNDLVYVDYNIRLWLRKMDRTLDVDAISLDNINVLSKWRVEVCHVPIFGFPYYAVRVTSGGLSRSSQRDETMSSVRS